MRKNVLFFDSDNMVTLATPKLPPQGATDCLGRVYVEDQDGVQCMAMCVVVGRRRMMEAPPPPPAVVVSTQNVESGNVVASPRRTSGPSDVSTQPRVSVVRHVSVPSDSSTSAVAAPLSHSLPRPASKISDDKVTVLLVADYV